MNKKYFLLLISTLLITFSLASYAEPETIAGPETKAEPDTESEDPLAKPDDDKVNPLDNVDINIIKREDKTIETHSVNGVVYKVKITPSSGPPYYLYDTDGNGSLETRSNRELSNTTVQQWKIFQW